MVTDGQYRMGLSFLLIVVVQNGIDRMRGKRKELMNVFGFLLTQSIILAVIIQNNPCLTRTAFINEYIVVYRKCNQTLFFHIVTFVRM